MFLLGRQAMFGHDPPTYLRSIAATRFPCPAKVQAAIVDPVPPPRITRSYSSGPSPQVIGKHLPYCLLRELRFLGSSSLLSNLPNVILSLHPASANKRKQQTGPNL